MSELLTGGVPGTDSVRHSRLSRLSLCPESIPIAQPTLTRLIRPPCAQTASRRRRTSLESEAAALAARSVSRFYQSEPGSFSPDLSAHTSLDCVTADPQTRVAQEVLKSLGVPWVLVVSQDNFYKTLTPEESKAARDNNHGALPLLLGTISCSGHSGRRIQSRVLISSLRCVPCRILPLLDRFRLARFVRLRQTRTVCARHERVSVGADSELFVRRASADKRNDVPVRRKRHHW